MLIALVAATFQITYTQKNYVEADGIIEYHNRIPLPGATLVLYDNGKEVKSLKTDQEGRYNFILEYNKEYILEISKKDMITKRVKYNTVMPPKAKGGWWVGIPINLYELCPGLDGSVFDEPVAIVRFDQGKKEYEADPAYDIRMRGRIRSFEAKNDACLEDKFVKLVRDAEQLANENKPEEARELFKKASEQRPWEEYPKEKLKELDNTLAKEDAKESIYDQNIQLADKLMAEGNLIAAKSYYKRALTVNAADDYAGQKIREIDKKLSKKEDELQESLKSDHQAQQREAEKQQMDRQYNVTISKGNTLLAQKNYIAAKTAFQSAQQIKPEETYPQQKIDEINRLQLLAQEQKNEVRAKELEYTNKINSADNLLNAGQYEAAKKMYADALNVKPGENYPRLKINHINEVVQQQALASKQHETASKYNKAIADGDGYLAINEYSLAKQSYNLASSIKAAEEYPKQKIAEIDKLIAEENNRKILEQENNKKYDEYIRLADKYYSSGELDKARDVFSKASGIKPHEIYPKERVESINELIASAREAEQRKAQFENEFNLAVTQADALLQQSDFNAAKLQYLKALRIKSNDTYVHSQIDKINAELASMEAQKLAAEKKKQEFNTLIASADKLLDGARYENAKSAYQKALEVEPNSDYVKKRIAQINDILAKLAASNKIVETETKKNKSGGLQELKFKDDAELEVYLFELKRKYPEGITHEIYKEEKKTIHRFVIIRNDEANEFREVQHYWGGRDYSRNDKPITQQYFSQQTKKRPNEYYNIQEM